MSTLEQDPALQHDALTAAGAAKAFTDFASGATAQRPQLTACLDYLRSGDTLAVWRIDRLGRSVEDFTRTVNELAAKWQEESRRPPQIRTMFGSHLPTVDPDAVSALRGDPLEVATQQDDTFTLLYGRTMPETPRST